MTEEYKICDYRTNGVVGVLELDGLVPVTLHFSEWWNGEGGDFNFLQEKSKQISLHMDEISAIVVAANLMGMIDFKEIKNKTKKVKKQTEEKRKSIEQFKIQVGIVD